MPRTHTPPARMDIRKDLAREALAAYMQWQVTGNPQAAPVILGKLTWMRQRTGASQPRKAATASVDADADAVKRQPRGDLLTAAEARFPEARTGQTPSFRDIQGAMRVGQGKAQQVQAHFRTLQAAA